MSSFGHVRDMMERYAANRDLLRAKRDRHFRKKSLYNNVKFEKRENYLKQLDKAGLEKVKARIRKAKKRERWLWFIVSVVVVISLILLSHWINHHQ